jgi:hypothetical protein
MGDVLVENPANHVPPHKKQAPAVSNIENFEGLQIDGADDYATLKKLQRQLEYDIRAFWGLATGLTSDAQIHPAARRVHQG